MRELPVLKFDIDNPESFGNLAEKLDEADRKTLATDLIELIKLDESSMSDWLGQAQGYLDELEDEGDAKPQNREQEGSNDGPPPSTEMTLVATIQFAAHASDAILGEPDLAMASEDDDGAVELASWVSTEVRTRDKNWVLDTDPLFVHMSVTGLAWRKRRFDRIDKTFRSYFLTCTEVIINKNVRSSDRAPRITHDFERYPYEIERSIQRGHWLDYGPVYHDRDPQAPKKFYECDCWLDLDGDGVDEPWIVTISRDDIAQVVEIVPRWSKKTIVNNDKKLYFNAISGFYPYRFLPDPKGGFFPMGFGKLLKRVQGSADALLAAITDTAETESQNGGVFSGGTGSGLPDSVELKQNRVTVLPLDGAPLANRWSPFPAKQVSPASVQVLEKTMTLGDRIAGTLNLMENAPASMTATMAKGIIDTGSKIQSAVHRRLVTAMTLEFRDFVTMADAYDMLPKGATGSNGGSVAVTADPQLATEMQRSAMAGVYFQMLEMPMVFNPQEAGLRFCKVMRLPQPQKLIATPQPPQATPYEKIQGYAHVMKQKTEHIKAIGAVAVQFTQALKNIADANGSMVNNQTMMLQLAQLEYTMQQLMQSANDAGTAVDGMAGLPGNSNAGALPPPSSDAGGGNVPSGGDGGPGSAGPGGSV